jgi:hypothetical protein
MFAISEIIRFSKSLDYILKADWSSDTSLFLKKIIPMILIFFLFCSNQFYFPTTCINLSFCPAFDACPPWQLKVQLKATAKMVARKLSLHSVCQDYQGVASLACTTRRIEETSTCTSACPPWQLHECWPLQPSWRVEVQRPKLFDTLMFNWKPVILYWIRCPLLWLMIDFQHANMIFY